MIKFVYLCDQSEEMKKKCSQYWHPCNPCAHTIDRNHAKNPQTVAFANKILEKFECVEGQDVVLYEKEDSNEH